MRLRHYLEQALTPLLAELQRLTLPLTTSPQMARLAFSICHDEPLAQALGEIFDTLGEQGAVEARSGHSRSVAWEFVEGSYVRSGLMSQAFPGERTITLEDAAIFVSDLAADDPQDCVRLVALVFALKKKTLVVMASQISEKVAALLGALNGDPQRLQVAVVKAPPDAHALEDLALLSGGRAFLRITGDRVSAATPDDLGSARRVWADRDYFGIVGGRSSPLMLRAHVAGLSRAFERTEDLTARRQLRERLGTLRGGAAVLRVGGSTDSEIRTRRDLAERSAEAVRGALAGGVFPGTGAALLACRPWLRRALVCADNLDQRMAYRILSLALEEPARAIIANAGYEAEPILARLSEPGTGFDARSGEFVDPVSAGIFDSAGVVLSAVRQAVSSAATALTIDVLFHHSGPQTSVNP